MAKKSKEARKKAVITVLNKARAMELQAIHQYMNQHYGLDDMDYGELVGTSSSTGLTPKGFATNEAGE